MAREKPIPEPTGDIPAWFMTYSDVITLLMTFFILLLTFSTTEPERFERIQKAVFNGGQATGIAGDPVKGPENESWIQRVRPRAARMAMQGAEMAPYKRQPSKTAVGNGLMGATEEETKQDVMSTNEIDVKHSLLIDENLNITSRGALLVEMLAVQLESLPVHLNIQVGNLEQGKKAVKLLSQLYQVHQIRPGQLGVSVVEDVSIDNIRFAIERYEK